MTKAQKNRSTKKAAWFHCFAGIAGDMALAGLIDAGAPIAEVRKMLYGLGLENWAIEPVPVLRSGIAATHLEIEIPKNESVRTLPQIKELVERADLPTRVRQRSMAAFQLLAEVEATLHRKDPDEVHFHELSGYDTILDVVGTMAALEVLDIDVICASEVAVGTGVINSAHGILPNPAPAVLALLEGAKVKGTELDFELTTPTGAALLASLAEGFGPMPAMRVEATGYGAGSKELDGLPNCTQVVIGAIEHENPGRKTTGQPLVLLEANLDDATGEQLADTVAALLAAGAQDAWVTPVVMKKGRPGHVVAALSEHANTSHLRSVLIDESGTFGVRSTDLTRFASTRRIDTVEIEGHLLRVKVRPGRAKVEHDDVVKTAKALGKPIREVQALAEKAWEDGSN